MNVVKQSLRLLAGLLLVLALPLSASAQRYLCPGNCIRDAEIEATFPKLSQTTNLELARAMEPTRQLKLM